ncbi:hypothetical protein [Deinococcus pimensis]|uniref:hypothetical protein n=1 Tax=Deinococcus pimensis TaxID=309888 RepID=UPI000487F019|nr:hypothetical protein [Deinococcus pimensis]
MKPLYIATPSGQLLNAHHIETIDVQGSGTQEQLRHQVQARSVSGDHHVLAVFKGEDSHQHARQFIRDLLDRLDADVLDPRTPPGERRAT